MRNHERRLNKLAGVVDSIDAQTCLGRKRRHSDDEHKQQPAPFLFVLFVESIRAEIQADGLSAAEQAKLAGEKWSALSREGRANFNNEAGGKRKAYRER